MSVEKITDQTRAPDHFALLMLVPRGLGKLLAEGRILAALHAPATKPALQSTLNLYLADIYLIYYLLTCSW